MNVFMILCFVGIARGAIEGWTSPAPGLQTANGRIELAGAIKEDSISAGRTLFLAKATGVGRINYTIKSSTDDVASINSASGEVSLAHGKGLDYESKTVYIIVVSANDQEGSEATATVLLSISDANDNAPVFTKSEFTIAQDHVPYGTPLVTLTAIDADRSAPNNVVRYSLSAKDAKLFSIDNVTGTITVVARNGFSFAEKGTGVVKRSVEDDIIDLAYDLLVVAFDLGSPQNIVRQFINLIFPNFANVFSASFSGFLLISMLVVEVGSW